MGMKNMIQTQPIAPEYYLHTYGTYSACAKVTYIDGVISEAVVYFGIRMPSQPEGNINQVFPVLPAVLTAMIYMILQRLSDLSQKITIGILTRI